jgi:hypothetical protein
MNPPDERTSGPRSALARAAVDHLADRLATPQPLPSGQGWRGQSLYLGHLGIALLHIERAHAGDADWPTAHAWLTSAVSTPLNAADDSGLHTGVTALAFALHAAQADGTERYEAPLRRLDQHVTALAHRRVDRAQARIDRGGLPAFAEYDLLHGLTGIGAHLLAHAPGNAALGRILTYLVRLTTPLRIDGETLPGWWVSHDPQRTHSPAFPGGHANLGLAHGITGPLALLAHASRHGITVDGHTDAITAICTWLDTWRHDTHPGPSWPEWITRHQHRAGPPAPASPARPSWCYGTPGIARTQQLAAIATADTTRQTLAEHALTGCFTDPAQLAHLADYGLCHGWAGLHQTAWRAAHDARTPALSAALPTVTNEFLRRRRTGDDAQTGLLDGSAGLALALHTAAHQQPPISGWDTCLLLC